MGYRRQLLLNYAYAFFKDFAFFSAVLVPFFTQWGGITLTQVQLIQSWFSLWVFILEVPTGAVADKIGRKHSIALGSLIVSLAVLLYGSIPRFEIFLLSEFLFAIGYALTSGADQALLFDTLKEEGKEKESVKVFGRANSFHLLGIATAAPIGSLIAARFGLNAPIMASSIPFFIAALIGWMIPEPAIRSDASKSPRYRDIIQKGLRVIRADPWVRTLAIDSVLVAASAYFVIWLYQPVLTSLGVPIFFFGFAHAFYLAAQILVSSNFSFLEKILGSRERYLRVSALVTALFFMVVAIYPNIVTVILFLMISGGVGLTRATYIVSIANAAIPSRERATVLSSIQMLRRFALIILNPFVGLTADYSLRLALFLIGLLPLGTLALSSTKKGRGTRRPASA